MLRSDPGLAKLRKERTRLCTRHGCHRRSRGQCTFLQGGKEGRAHVIAYDSAKIATERDLLDIYAMVKWALDDTPDAVQAAEDKEDLMSEVIKYTIESEQQQQHGPNAQTLSHGLQPPTTPSSLEHTHQLIAHQRHPSFTTGATGGACPTNQSIHLVAAPNPHRYITDDPLGAAAATAALYGSLPLGAVSPHSLTGKSIGGGFGDRGGAGSSTYASSRERVLMITSFNSLPRPDVIAGASNSLGSHVQNSFGQVPRRNSSFATPDRAYPIENTSIGRNLTTDVHRTLMVRVSEMESVNAVDTANDLTMSSDLVATAPSPLPTDFGLPPHPSAVVCPKETNDAAQYPASSTNSPLKQHHFKLTGESGIEWLGSPSRHPFLTLVRGETLVQQAPGVHCDLKV
ncbi:unnamed protein product [Taenia asiatica]|uniref:Uncharacterized protein n=1 Tax=Taenia asiatica TaxID=60517 RepID=A0A158RAE5_TAEAS|nr:unnamed protein product [Taenia asiatica]